MWWLYALLAAIFAALTSIFAKIGIEGVDSNLATAIRTVVVVRMKAQGDGVILMTASTNGTEGHRWYADYNASKAGVILLVKTMALELAPVVRVNCVCPGYVLTPMQRAEYADAMLAEVNEGIPMKRHAEPEEIAALFAFLASDDARYITGADLRIDGGETAGLY